MIILPKIITTIFSMTVLYRLRGDDFGKPLTSKPFIGLYAAVIIQLLFPVNPFISIPLLAATFYLAVLFGWGEYFPVEGAVSFAKEVFLIDWITNLIVGKREGNNSPDFHIKWRTVGMSLRYLIFFIPFFAALGWLYTSPVAAGLTWLTTGLAGPVYRFALRKEYPRLVYYEWRFWAKMEKLFRTKPGRLIKYRVISEPLAVAEIYMGAVLGIAVAVIEVTHRFF